MSVITVIKAAIGNLEAVTSRIKPKGVKLRGTKIMVLPDPPLHQRSVGEPEGAGWAHKPSREIGSSVRYAL